MDTFPIRLSEHERSLRPDCPTQVPFAAIAEHAHQCRINFGKTPEQLARDGGLSPFDIRGAVKGLNHIANARGLPTHREQLDAGVDVVLALNDVLSEAPDPAWAQSPANRDLTPPPATPESVVNQSATDLVEPEQQVASKPASKKAAKKR